MLARIEWLNDCIDRMLVGKRPTTPERWGMRDSIMNKDVDLLRQAAQFASLRPGASEPDPLFISEVRKRILAEAGKAE
jgi:hypothetical protein